MCSGVPVSPFGAGDKHLPWVASWFGFLDFALLFHSVSLSLTSSGFFRRPRVKGIYSTKLFIGPWLCDPSAVCDQVEVAANGCPQQWPVPWWLCSVLCAQCSLVFAVAVSPYVPAMVAGMVDLVFSVASCALLGFSAASGFPLEVLAWCDDWVCVASGHRVSSWCFGIWFGVVLLHDTMAWGQWVLTQTLTGCPDRLLVSALAILIQSCLDLVFSRLWLCFSLLVLVLFFTLAVLWCSHPCLHALVHALVPLVCIYFEFICFALPGADAMEDSSFFGSSFGDYAHTQELSKRRLILHHKDVWRHSRTSSTSTSIRSSWSTLFRRHVHSDGCWYFMFF